jgi:hypothetical protein
VRRRLRTTARREGLDQIPTQAPETAIGCAGLWSGGGRLAEGCWDARTCRSDRPARRSDWPITTILTLVSLVAGFAVGIATEPVVVHLRLRAGRAVSTRRSISRGDAVRRLAPGRTGERIHCSLQRSWEAVCRDAAVQLQRNVLTLRIRESVVRQDRQSDSGHWLSPPKAETRRPAESWSNRFYPRLEASRVALPRAVQCSGAR